MSRLNVLKERIESIEALVTIDLDHRRNELVAFDLVNVHMPYLVRQMHRLMCGCCIQVCYVHAVAYCADDKQSVS